MKEVRNLASWFLFVPMLVVASEYVSPLENTSIIRTENDFLIIHNLSMELVKVDIYGELIELPASSGVSYDCKGYYELELVVQDNRHDYFEVLCQSKLTFTENFTNQSKQ